MSLRLSTAYRWLFGPDIDPPGYLATRWLFLRSLGLIFFSVFYSLAFQIRGLIGPRGILPAQGYLQDVASSLGRLRFWYAPTVLWWSASDRALMAICIVGILAAVLLVLNVWPRVTIAICLVAFLSFVSAAQDFSGYQSDGMLLEAGFISLFFAPPGWHGRWGASAPASRASRFLLIWLWFRIYFESGMAKLLGGGPEWRNFTAMDDYYQNGPLPTWIAWYAQHLPQWFHVGTAFLTLALELVLIFAVFLPRPFRLALFFLVTPWQIGIILTSNYAFLNYLVLVLGFLLLDDVFLERWLPRRMLDLAGWASPSGIPERVPARTANWRAIAGMSVQSVFLTWIFYATAAPLAAMIVPQISLPARPVIALDPFRIANQFGLFAVMTRERYEIEFQGSQDGVNWTAYPFRYKPQDVHKAPGIYAPYQPRFDWNLWFASLDNWRSSPFVVDTERRLLAGEPDVLALFAGNPFPGGPPKQVRAVRWQYWFSSPQEMRQQGVWWRRELLGLYAPRLELSPDGKLVVLEMPGSAALAPEP